MTKFKKLTISNWQQFKDITIDFHEKMTVITGANGSGKTTILNILAQHFGWSTNSIAIPRKNLTTSILEWFSGLFVRNETSVGEIIYKNDQKATLLIPQVDSAQYSVKIIGKQLVEGFIIPSHKTPFRYEQVSNLSLRTSFDKEQAFSKVSSSIQSRYMGAGGQSSSFHMKEVLISWNILGYGNPTMAAKEELLKNFNDFEKVLSIILPENLGFKKLEIRDFEIVFICEQENEFLLDAASGGISALIDLAWQIHMFSTEKRNNFVVLIDEVENHLHPAMQRRVLHDLLLAFPKASFIVSTHSPLIVSSVKESNVIALRYKENKVYSEKLDLVNKPRTATEILDEVLGVSFTMPVWAEEVLKKITDTYLAKSILTAEDLNSMRSELTEAGLGRLMPEAIYKIATKND